MNRSKPRGVVDVALPLLICELCCLLGVCPVDMLYPYNRLYCFGMTYERTDGSALDQDHPPTLNLESKLGGRLSLLTTLVLSAPRRDEVQKNGHESLERCKQFTENEP